MGKHSVSPHCYIPLVNTPNTVQLTVTTTPGLDQISQRFHMFTEKHIPVTNHVGCFTFKTNTNLSWAHSTVQNLYLRFQMISSYYVFYFLPQISYILLFSPPILATAS